MMVVLKQVVSALSWEGICSQWGEICFRLVAGQLGEVASYQYGGCFLDAMQENVFSHCKNIEAESWTTQLY